MEEIGHDRGRRMYIDWFKLICRMSVLPKLWYAAVIDYHGMT